MPLDTEVLTRRAQELAAQFTQDVKGWAVDTSQGAPTWRNGEGMPITRVKFNKGPKEGETVTVARGSRDHIMLQLYNLTNKAEYDFIVTEMKKYLGSTPMIDFNARLAKHEARA